MEEAISMSQLEDGRSAVKWSHLDMVNALVTMAAVVARVKPAQDQANKNSSMLRGLLMWSYLIYFAFAEIRNNQGNL